MSLFVSFGKATEDDEGDNHANLGVKDGAGEGGTDEKGVEWCQNYQKGKAKTNSEKDNSTNPTHFGFTSSLFSTPITSPLFKSSSSSQKSQNIHDDGAPRETELPLYITARPLFSLLQLTLDAFLKHIITLNADLTRQIVNRAWNHIFTRWRSPSHRF